MSKWEIVQGFQSCFCFYSSTKTKGGVYNIQYICIYIYKKIIKTTFSKKTKA